MPHEHTVRIITGLVLVASVILMIGSLDRVSRNLRGPQAHPRAMFHAAEFR
jgi:hypothetical protein